MIKFRIAPIIYFLALLGGLMACKNSPVQSSSEDLVFSIIQINDVYEIAPLEGGKIGGMARVAQLKKDLAKEGVPLITVLAGDFLSPSLIGTLKDEKGQRIKGLHMVEVMNASGVDYVTFGNHEFDISEEELQERMDASDFTWFSANVRQQSNGEMKAFQKNAKPVPDYVIHEFKSPLGKVFKLGLTASTLPFNKAPYVAYKDVFTPVLEVCEKLKEEVDITLVLSHLNLEQDLALAKKLSGVPLIMGGHEHVNIRKEVGETRVCKADANAKTAYVHRFYFNSESKDFKITSELVEVNEQIAQDPAVKKEVEKWQSIAQKSMESMGYQPQDLVFSPKEPLDGREETVRYKICPLGSLIAESFMRADKEADLAFFNSGSIRIDDWVSGSLSQIDILRILPFGGELGRMECQGSELKKILETGRVKNYGKGGFLQLSGAEKKSDGKWYIQNKVLEEGKTYRMVLPKFLAQGGEENLEFLKEYPFEILDTQKILGIPNDVRQVLIHFLKS